MRKKEHHTGLLMDGTLFRSIIRYDRQTQSPLKSPSRSFFKKGRGLQAELGRRTNIYKMRRKNEKQKF